LDQEKLFDEKKQTLKSLVTLSFKSKNRQIFTFEKKTTTQSGNKIVTFRYFQIGDKVAENAYLNFNEVLTNDKKFQVNRKSQLKLFACHFVSKNSASDHKGVYA